MKINKIAKKISYYFSMISFVVLFGVMLFTMVCIVLRYVVHSPVKGSTEIFEVVLAVMVFAGLAYTQSEKRHIHVMMVIQAMPRKLAIFIFAFNAVLSTVCSGMATFACFQQGNYALRKGLASVILGIPFYPFYYFASLSLLLFTIVLLLDALIAFGALFNNECKEYISEYWNG